MNRFEDQFKDAFEHFEPEVDPKLWQNISQQLSSAPQVNQEAVSAGKSIASKLGWKGILGLAAAATISTLTILYVTKGPEVVSTREPEITVAVDQQISAGEEIITEPSVDQNVISNPTGSTSDEKQAIPTASDTKRNAATSLNSAIVQHLPNTALTGDNSAGKGEPSIPSGSPIAQKDNPQQVNIPDATAAFNNPTKPASESAPAQEIKPVLLVSGKGGFAPLTITALNNQLGVSATYNFGDGSSNVNAINASHTYTEPGIYSITCQIKGVTLEQKIEVIGQIPSAFSPNGDGINDYFTINNIENVSVEIRIYTRTGKLMFNGKGHSLSWDGRTPDGENAEAGTYLYDIFATPEGGSSYKQKGTLHLFR